MKNVTLAHALHADNGRDGETVQNLVMEEGQVKKSSIFGYRFNDHHKALFISTSLVLCIN